MPRKKANQTPPEESSSDDTHLLRERLAATAITAARKAVAEGATILDQAHDRFNLPRGGNGGMGPRMRDWSRGAFPPRRPTPLAQAVMEGEISMLKMVEYVVAAEKAGRPKTAGLGLARLRERFDTYDPADLPEAERTWPAFVAKRIPLPPERVAELIGIMVHRSSILHCPKCGAETHCPCGCGVPYVGEHRWAAPVTEIVTEIPRRGRPPSGAAQTDAERARKYRTHKRNLPAPPTPAQLDHDLIQEMHPDAITSEQRFIWSASNLLGDVIAAAKYWDREFPGWQKFAWPPELRTLFDQATTEMKVLQKEERHGKKA